MPQSLGHSNKFQTILMALICALLMWFGRLFVELKMQTSRIESDTVYIRINQNEMKQEIRELDERIRDVERDSYAKVP
jgi:phosphoribulokinase